MDTLSKTDRSRVMAAVKATGTRPEMTVRRLLHSLGYRYRLHVKKLPGRPDLVFAGRKCIIFVHGCFWHRHAGCKLARMPKSRLDFWGPKLTENRRRDARAVRALRRQGWRVLVVWECELASPEPLTKTLRGFLDA